MILIFVYTGATIVLKIVIAISSCESDFYLWCVVLSLLAASTCVLPSQSIIVFGIIPISSFLKIDHLSQFQLNSEMTDFSSSCVRNLSGNLRHILRKDGPKAASMVWKKNKPLLQKSSVKLMDEGH